MKARAKFAIGNAKVRLRLILKQATSKVGLGCIILLLAAALYLGSHVVDALACLLVIVRELIMECSFSWWCLAGVVGDLRRDNTAATVILAIAAAVLASAWSNGGSGAPE